MRERLRATTEALHQRVERACPFGPELDRRAYVDHLARRLGFQAELETRLARWRGWDEIGLACPSDGAALLTADLRCLGWSEQELRSLPTCDALPELSSFARAVGSAYVLEGARIGGRTIAHSVSRRLDLGGRGVAFLSGGYPRCAVGLRFLASVAAIDRYAARLDDAGRDEIVAGARDTFATLARWLEQGTPSRG